MRSSIKRNLIISMLLVIIIPAAAIAGSVILIKENLNKYDDLPVVNQVRMETNNIVQTLRENYTYIDSQDIITNKIKSELDRLSSEVLVADLTGKIIYDSQQKDNIGKFIDLSKDISYDLSYKNDNPGRVRYSAPLVINGEEKGTVVFNIPGDMVLQKTKTKQILFNFAPIVAAMAVLLIALIQLSRRIIREIITPLKELNLVSESIAKGDLSKKIKYDEESELGSFCRSFDLMREELIFSRNRQQELEESRKELIACISHDLRTPISSIKAYVEGLQDGIAKDRETAERYIGVIKRKTDELSKLINDLFQHSQADLGKMKISLKEVYSRELLDKIVEPLKVEFAGSAVRFTAEQPFPNFLIKADAERIGQVILNLVQNAKKYSSQGGQIHIRAAADEQKISIYVTDQGMGITPEDMPYVFERFYRGEKSRSKDYGGAGLGLYICKYIVDKHNGTITVQSSVNKGTTFCFTIPKV